MNKSRKKINNINEEYSCKILRTTPCLGYSSKPFYRLVYVIQSAIDIVLNEERISLQEYQYSLFKPSDELVFESFFKNAKILYVEICESAFKRIITFLGGNCNDYIIISKSLLSVIGDFNVKQKMDEFINRILKYGDEDFLICKLISFELISGIMRQMHRKQHRDEIPMQIVSAVNELRSLDKLQRGVIVLDEALHYSRTHLCRLFKKYYEMTPQEYVKEMRLGRAYNLIVFTDEDYESIAESVGFNSISHFYKIFHSRYGFTPSMLRNHKDLSE
jgi:AraC-like DNA-binding protein